MRLGVGLTMKKASYCTKCGAELAPQAARCPHCGAPVAGAATTSRRAHAARWAVAAAAVIAVGVGVVVALRLSSPRAPAKAAALSGAANIAESAPAAEPHTVSAATAASPSMGLFELPAADRNFVGTWGGYARVDPGAATRVGKPMLPMTFYFGRKNGVVFLRTEVYGSPQWPVVGQKVETLDPKRVRFELDSACNSCTPPAREVEVTTLTLTDKNTMNVECTGYTSWQGDGHSGASYHGVLHLLNAAQAQAIDQQARQGGVLLTKINSAGQVGR